VGPTAVARLLLVNGEGEWGGRLHKCITSLEAFDLQKARKRAPAVLELEAAIDKALSSAFGYGTSTYLRYWGAARIIETPG
jgi:hypothetical protein